MFMPKYLIRLKKNVFQESKGACLGIQLFELLNFIETLISPHIWYVADLDTNSNSKSIEDFKSFSLKKTDSSFKEIVKNIDQFLSGVFLAIKTQNNFEGVFVETEDPEFRTLNIDGVIIEIRAFDTSYFELYSDDYVLIKKILDNYNIDVKDILYG